MRHRKKGWRRARKVWRLALPAAVVSVVLWRAGRTVEWGNLLHRSGAFHAAASVYRGSLEDEEAPQGVAFNLGTTLLQAESDEAEHYLELAAAGPDSTIAQKAHYNVGYGLLRAAEGSSDQVAGVALLLEAIRNNRAALRLDPTDEDARWNLALAQRRYESFANIYEEGPVEPSGDEAGGPPEEEGEATGRVPGMGAGTDDDGSRPPDAGDEEGGGTGARETLLREGDPGPLSGRDARRLLESVTDDPTLLVLGVLWSQRPTPEGP